MQIILTKEEYDKLKPIEQYTGYQLANELVEKCKLNTEAKTTTFEVQTVIDRDNETNRIRIAKYKVSVEQVDTEIIITKSSKNLSKRYYGGRDD